MKKFNIQISPAFANAFQGLALILLVAGFVTCIGCSDANKTEVGIPDDAKPMPTVDPEFGDKGPPAAQDRHGRMDAEPADDN